MYDFDTVYSREDLCSIKWDIAKRQGMEAGAIPFTVADMELRTAPEIIAAVQEFAAGGLWGYTHGNEAFKDVVAGWMRSRHGWPAKGEWIVNTAGVVPALYTAVLAYTQPGEGVLLQPPVYTPFFDAITRNGRTLVENPLVKQGDSYCIDFDDLRVKAKKAKLMIFCSPHNPVGRVWTREEVAEVAQICRENGVVLFSDEIHCDILASGVRFTSAGGLGEEGLGNLLVGTSASKTFSLAGLSCSSIFIPDAGLRARFETTMGALGQEFNAAFGVVATRTAYQQGVPWLDALLEYLAGNAAVVQGFLRDRLPAIKMARLEGTYLAWLDFSALGLDETACMTLLQQQAQLFLGSGTAYGTGGEGHLRMNLACPRSQIENAMIRLEKCVKNL